MVPLCNYQQKYQNSGSWGKNEGSENSPEGQTQQLWPYHKWMFSPYYMQRHYWNPPIFEPSCARCDGGCLPLGCCTPRYISDREYISCYRPWFRKEFSHQRQTRENSSEEDKENQEMRPKISSHFNVNTAATSVTDTDTQKTLNHS